MPLLNTYDNKEEAEFAEQAISGDKRLASERDGTETIYNLFGVASWGNFYKLNMFNLPLLEKILESKKKGVPYDKEKYQEILSTLKYVESTYKLKIPNHWY